eukprot:3099637-Ditylum_brightwellii.AAC.1
MSCWSRLETWGSKLEMWGRTARRSPRCWMPWSRLARIEFLGARWVAQLPCWSSPRFWIQTGVHGLQPQDLRWQEAPSWGVDGREMKELGAGKEVDTIGLSGRRQS